MKMFLKVHLLVHKGAHCEKEVDTFSSTIAFVGDFNGDGEFDIAIQVISKTSRKRGIVFLHSNDLNYHVIGAGKSFGDLGDDFSWLKKWRIDSFSLQQSRISARAEALILDNPDFPKSLVYFDGKTYRTQGLDAYSYYSDGPVYSQVLPQL